MIGAVVTSPDSVDEFGKSVVTAARSWVGTPFHWQQSVRGKGCDCKGLIAGVARDLGRAEAASRFAAMGDYRPGKVPLLALAQGLRELFDRVWTVEPGDILQLHVGGAPQHLAIVSETIDGRPIRMIHCYSKGPARVIEVPMGHVWRDAIASIWRWRAEAGEAPHVG